MTESETPGRRRGRSARRAARLYGPIVHLPTLRRRVTVFEVANAEGVELIHDLAMRIVEEIGVEFRDEESLALWRGAGAEVEGERVRLDRERAEDTVQMLKLVFGEERGTRDTFATSLINSNSPLVWDQTMLDALKVYAAANQAVMCSPFCMTAASTPASNTGTMAMVTAEALMAVALAQIVRPGSPMLFGVPAMTVALNTGAPVHGSPDSAIVHFLGAAHTRRSNLFIFPSQSNITYEQWSEEGAKDSAAAGLEKAKRWLARYEPPPIDPALDEALRDFVARREREIPASLR